VATIKPYPSVLIKTIDSIYKGGGWMFQAYPAKNIAVIRPQEAGIPNRYIENSITYLSISDH
jgi:hypothetical protein